MLLERDRIQLERDRIQLEREKVAASSQLEREKERLKTVQQMMDMLSKRPDLPATLITDLMQSVLNSNIT